MKVIMVNGQPLNGRAVVLRTLGRIVDVLPVFYLVGWIAMRGAHKPPQRLFCSDRAGRTLRRRDAGVELYYCLAQRERFRRRRGRISLDSSYCCGSGRVKTGA